MGDPITALAAIGLADNVLSFLQLGVKLTREAYSSIDGLSNDLGDARDVAQKLRTTNESLQEGLTKLGGLETGYISRADRDLIAISRNCEVLARDFISMLDKYKVPSDSRFKAAKTVSKAIQAAWSRDETKRIENLLQKYQNQFDSRVIVAIRVRQEESHIETNARFENLQRTLKEKDTGIVQSLDEIKELLNRPRSPIPEYGLALHSRSDTPSSVPLLGIPGHAKPINSGDLRITSTPLHEAARKGDKLGVRRALAISNIDINTRDDNGQTALHICVDAGHCDLVEFLCQKQADPNIEDLIGSTPLHLAAECADIDMVKSLLKSGATDTFKDDSGLLAINYAEKHRKHLLAWILRYGVDLERQIGPEKRTALQSFIENEQVGDAAQAIRQGADVRVLDEQGNSTLMNAIGIDPFPMLPMVILKACPDIVNVQNSLGETALLLAASDKHDEAHSVEFLLDHKARLDLKDNEKGFGTLLRALMQGHFRKAEALVQNGASLEEADKEGYTPLQRLASWEKLSAVQWIVNAGADIDLQRDDGWCALYDAVHSGHHAVVAELLNKGASTECRTGNRGWTPAFQAASAGNIGILGLLEMAGANLETTECRHGLSPLAAAVIYKRTAVVRFLVQTKVYLETKDKNGYTALHLAYKHEQLQAAKLLLEAGANPSSKNIANWTCSHEAILLDRRDMLELILRYNPDLGIRTKRHGRTALIEAIVRKRMTCASLLVAAGATLEAHSVEGSTALDEAVIANDEEMVECLLQAGAHPDGGNTAKVEDMYKVDRQWSPLMYAAKENRVDMCHLLLEHGANVYAESTQGNTALSVARQHGWKNIAELLMEHMKPKPTDA